MHAAAVGSVGTGSSPCNLPGRGDVDSRIGSNVSSVGAACNSRVLILVSPGKPESLIDECSARRSYEGSSPRLVPRVSLSIYLSGSYLVDQRRRHEWAGPRRAVLATEGGGGGGAGDQGDSEEGGDEGEEGGRAVGG